MLKLESGFKGSHLASKFNYPLPLSEQRKLRSFVEPLSGGEVSLSGSEVSPVVARLPISLTSLRARNEYSLFSSLRQQRELIHIS
jgi:hypothetical protein